MATNFSSKDISELTDEFTNEEECENVEDLGYYSQAGSSIKLLSNYLKANDELLGVVNSALDKIKACNEKKLALNSQIFTSEQIVQNLMSIINFLPKSFINRLMDIDVILFCYLSPDEAARQIGTNAEAIGLIEEENFELLSEYSEGIYKEFLNMIKAIMFNADGQFKDLSYNQIESVIEGSELKRTLTNGTTIEITDAETIISEGEEIVFKNGIGYKFLASVIKDNYEKFTKNLTGKNDIDKDKPFSKTNWVDLLQNIELVLSETSKMTQEMIDTRNEIDMETAMKNIKIDFSVPQDNDPIMESLVRNIDLMITSVFTKIKNQWTNQSSYPSVSEFNVNILNVMNDPEYIGTLANIDVELEKQLNGRIPTGKVFRFKI